MRWLEAMGTKRYMCICDGCVGARDDTYWGGKRSIALTAMGIFFSSERLVVAPDNKTLKMERERQQQQKRSHAICCRDYRRITQHSTAQHSIA